ncbi:hypothetical protein Fmac_014737 [Flemingia macrophylla]|uniref:Secreted protein n=1 Tax=Flemingia macrophylla TaxID=520843 RepID=A0ABD1MCM3_9FABA
MGPMVLTQVATGLSMLAGAVLVKSMELTRYAHCAECQVETLRRGDVHMHRVSICMESMYE